MHHLALGFWCSSNEVQDQNQDSIVCFSSWNITFHAVGILEVIGGHLMSKKTFPVWCPERQIMVRVKGEIRNVIYPEFIRTLHVESCPHPKCPDKHKRDCIINHEIQGNW